MVYPLALLDQTFELHPDGCLFWKEKRFLFISDVHLGKVSHFRKLGAAVPRGAIPGNFLILSKCLDRYQPEAICFLGDLFHSYLNGEWQLFENWVKQRDCQIILIAGNHDIISPLKYEALGINVVRELVINNFLFTHHPEDRQGFFTICGHIHPAIRLHGKARQSIRVPCFYKGSQQLIMPAFGAFTGMHTLVKENGHEIFAIADEEIIKF
jgi:DNA ligase-associated metallophosphoesterase